MNKLKLIPFIVVLFGCSSKISEHFEQNRYIRNYNIHILNDSLQLYFKSPADIVYTTERKKLKKIIRKADFKLKDRVLVYGKTDNPPYEYFVTVSNNPQQKYPKDLVVYDTLINHQTFHFIGNSIEKSAKRNLESDLKDISQSLEIGSTYRKEISTVMDVVEKYKPSNKFYAALNEISEFPTYDRQEEQVKQQMELTFSSFLGTNDFYESFLNRHESRFKPNKAISTTLKANSVYGSQAIDTIIHQAAKHKIVMINENHFYPNHRLLVFDLLEKLKKLGYDYLALEALGPQQDSLLNIETSYPTIKTGFYISEQNYSNVIRKAKEIGYQFVAYENTDNNKNRELGQAENLYNRTFKLEPDCKVLVLAGLDHILEKPTSRGKEWMATLFKTKYNIDPLTISQSHLNLYRNQSDSNYSLINSAFFDNERLNSVDYLVLNNKKNPILESQSTYSYKNREESKVQVSLFYGNEIEDTYDYHNRVPYFSTILEPGRTYNLPIDKDREIYLYTFDKNGRRIDKQIISPANKG